MIRFTVHNLGEHTIENLMVEGPFREVVGSLLETFLATYGGPTGADLDYEFVTHLIAMSHGQGEILERTAAPPEKIH
ncbi:hypothetical protein [Desulforhopalus singaporensis]|uniref:Uncharacterized protein n=1 Tax=Desulforhopalus singaporensis TaxID=91360 RepID=A0A1H0QYZ3_9BACT|nr:hypothetical protein [Desulforhopalus singaporensis]SDP22533.1 hypothetical protein SAMN05660330_02140 [Desulforhopalus singaporensis]